MPNEEQQLPAVHEAWLPREHALHRPRHGGRQLTALICALVFFVTPTLLWVFGVRPAEIENRKLTGFPSLSEGWGFFTGLPAWATDQLSFRGGAIAAADGISRTLFGESAPHDQGNGPATGPLPGSPPPPAGPQQQNTPTEPGPSDGSQAGYRQVVEGNDGWLYYGFDAEAKCLPSRPLTDTMARMDRLRQAVESSGRKFVFVIAPDKTTMVPQHLPGSYPYKDCSRAVADQEWGKITMWGGALDLRPELRASEGRMGRPVYPSNDTHWTDEGALVMTRGVANAIQPGITSTWQSAGIGQYSVAADLPPLIGRRGDKTNVLYDLRPDGVTNRAGENVADIDRPTYRTSEPITGTVDGKTLVYGDSFTRSAARYLAGGFSDLTMLAYFTKQTDQNAAIDAFVNSDNVVIETVERSIFSGNLPFLDDGFLNAVQRKLAQHPIR